MVRFKTRPVREALEILLEQILRGTIAAATVAEQEQGLRFGIHCLPFGDPPLEDAVASELAGVAANAEIDVAAVAFEIVQPVGNDNAAGERREIVIEDAPDLRGEQMAVAIELPQKLAFFRVDAEDGIERIEVKLFEDGDEFKLLIAIVCWSHRYGLEGLASAQMEGQMDLEQVQMLVNGIDQTDAPGQKVAREFAKRALAEAAKAQSGLRCHSTVGLLGTERNQVESRLRSLAGNQPSSRCN